MPLWFLEQALPSIGVNKGRMRPTYMGKRESVIISGIEYTKIKSVMF